MEKAVAKMRAGAASLPKATFAIPANRFHVQTHQRTKALARRSLRKFIRPENAAQLIPHLPAPGDILHAVLRGDFVLGDALPLILAHTGPSPQLWVATLGLSVANARTLRSLVETGTVGRITLILSHYFRNADKLTTYPAICAVLRGIADIRVTRSHAKVILIPSAAGHHLVFSGSGNLRSSGNLEALDVFNDPELLAFHRAWMQDIDVLEVPRGEPTASLG